MKKSESAWPTFHSISEQIATIDVPGRVLQLTPHLPPTWPGVTVRQFPFGQGQLSLELYQSPGRLTADLNTTGVPVFELEFSPALPAGAKVVLVTQQGKSVPFQTTDNGSDVHVQVKLTSVIKANLEVGYRGGIRVDVPWQPLLEGDSSRNLRVLKIAYQNGQFQMPVEGRPELKYDIRLLTPWLVSAGSSAEDVLVPMVAGESYGSAHLPRRSIRTRQAMSAGQLP